MMLNAYLFLAQVKPELDPETLRRAVKPGETNREIIIILACALALSLVLFIWAFFIRKRPKSARGSLVVERVRRGSKSSAPPEEEDGSKRRRRKRRPDHPDNWGRNPTLGETGGLPPARTEDSNDSPDDPDSDAPPNDNPPRVLRPR
jgi:hypothetical protein